MQFLLRDPDALLYHNEPIWRDNAIVGYVASAMYGHTLGGAVGLGYVDCENMDDEALLSADYEIEVATQRQAASVSLAPMYDPKNQRIRS